MVGHSTRRNPIYRCLTYHQSGHAACHCNTIQEAALVACLTRKIAEEYTSEPALSRLREALEQEQGRAKPRPADLKRLQNNLAKLDRKIAYAEDVVLEAPPNLRLRLYAKLETLTRDRDALQSELDALKTSQARSSDKDGSEIEAVIGLLRDLGNALSEATLEELAELFASFIRKIELQFEPGSKTKRQFSAGTVFVRPGFGLSHKVEQQPTLN